MATVSLSGNDTLKINNRSLTDLADGEVGKISFPNELVGVKTGKNGNSLYGFNHTGKQCELTLRLIRGSADDKFMLSLLTQMQNNFPGFPLLTGQFIKVVGDGKGNVVNDTYVLSGGIFSKQVEADSNAEGSTDQSVAIYTLKFTVSPRVVG